MKERRTFPERAWKQVGIFCVLPAETDSKFYFSYLPNEKHCILLRFLEVIVKIEKSQNLHLFLSNLILCHLYTVNIAKIISIAVHKEIVLFIHKGSWFLSLKLFFRTLATMICSSCTLFCFTFCFISICSFNNFSRANKSVEHTVYSPRFSKPPNILHIPC